jgi:5'-3' exonuclease
MNLTDPDDKQIVIVSTDKDMDCMVLGGTIVRYDPRPNKDGKCIMYGVSDILAKYGIEPYRLVDLFAMAGDSSDGIKGIEGIGKTYATAALKQTSSMRELFRKAREGKLLDLSEKTQRKIADGEKQFWHCRKLVQLREDLVEETPIEAYRLAVGSPLRGGHGGVARSDDAVDIQPQARGGDVRSSEAESGVSGLLVGACSAASGETNTGPRS